METNIGLYSYALATFAYVVLAIMLYLSRRGGNFGWMVIVATVISIIWAGVISWGTTTDYPPVTTIRISEWLRNGAWLYMLLTALNPRETALGPSRNMTLVFLSGMTLSLLILLLPNTQLYAPISGYVNWWTVAYFTCTGIALCGLVAVEQVYQNASESERWANKFLCLGLGGLFMYDFLMYADAMLFNEINSSLWQARGLVNSLAVPFIAIAAARNPVWRLDIHVSRKVVFHTATLLGAGIYLLAMAGAGYLIRYQGGTWGGVMQIFFLAFAIVMLLTLLFSGQLRAKVRVWVAKHFFSYRYDYREEWLNFTNDLSSSGDDVPQRITRALAGMMDSGAALLWARQRNGSFALMERWNISKNDIPPPEALAPITAWCARTQWVIDIDEYRREPQLYEDLVIPDAILNIPRAWLLLPLLQGDQVVGLLLMTRSPLHDTMNWEDRDLLRTAGQQAASHLAQHIADQALVEARQFEAFNRLSAYVVHDLKNILAQQSLIVTNARKHKHKPEFVDDVIMTVENSVNRMTKLMTQMRDGMRGSHSDTVELPQILEQIVARRAGVQPTPDLTLPENSVQVIADADQLATVFLHLIQNAQDATEPSGTVSVALTRDDNSAIVTITDTGCGMSEEFIRERLFKPFDSTKGLTGMGIGAFESREYIRSLGGEIHVKSAPDEGSTFTIMVPLGGTKDTHDSNNEQGAT
ncbi:MAG: PEP-CTERM system histidine kinase PrsK [Gammaproteobacteria bacterium]|nr:MAG: PEP-CTERM system histidine kinase PrsK [Gammaproteobacteria bacterium]